MPDLPPKWELAACEAGDFTLRERDSGQLMHSRIGPWAEANAVYVAQSHFGAETQDPEPWPVLYDVGMGIAANSLAAIATLQKLRIFSFELHPEGLQAALLDHEKFPFLSPYREMLETLLQEGEWRSENLEWKLISGDFRRAQLDGLPCANWIYFDFYAPSTCPELWTPEVFRRLRAKAGENASLITYASSKAVRAALLLAGFYVGEGAGTAMKGSTTVASPDLAILQRPLGPDWLDSLERATHPLPGGWQELRKHPQFEPFSLLPSLKK